MPETFEVTLRLPKGAWVEALILAGQLGLTPVQFITRAIGFAQTIEAARSGGNWVGTTGDRERLDTVIVPPL